jgi:hypothetical protein
MWLKAIKFPARSRALLAAKTPQPIDVLMCLRCGTAQRAGASALGRRGELMHPLLVSGAPDVGRAEVRGSWFSGRFCHQIAVMMSDPGNSFFTLIPHCIFRGGAWDLR